jgi:ribosomal protein L20A (L18A)
VKQFYIKAYNSAVKYGNNQLRKMVWAENKDEAYDKFYKQFEEPETVDSNNVYIRRIIEVNEENKDSLDDY